jgi:hypothetical protein
MEIRYKVVHFKVLGLLAYDAESLDKWILQLFKGILGRRLHET